MRRSVLFSFALLLAACHDGAAQDIVSASSGVLQYFEGVIVLDGQPIAHKAAVFPSLKNGSILRTEKGRAELLLTPAAYLRVDENSSLQMASNSLSDTRLELTDGAAIIDTINASPGAPVAIIFRGSEVRFTQPGVYRIDCDLGELQVYSGEAKVSHHGASWTVDSLHRYYFTLELTTNKFGDGMTDEFYDWARSRSDTIADQMAAAAQESAQEADPGGAGIFVAPPVYASPSYGIPFAPQQLGYSSYGSTIDPFFLYSTSPYFGYAPFPTILVLSPFHRPAVSRWPASSGIGYHAPSVVTRWPRPTQGAFSNIPAAPLHYPIGAGYYRFGMPIVGTAVRAAPHLPSPSVAPHVAVPRAGGHR